MAAADIVLQYNAETGKYVLWNHKDGLKTAVSESEVPSGEVVRSQNGVFAHVKTRDRRPQPKPKYVSIRKKEYLKLFVVSLNYANSETRLWAYESGAERLLTEANTYYVTGLGKQDYVISSLKDIDEQVLIKNTYRTSDVEQSYNYLDAPDHTGAGFWFTTRFSSVRSEVPPIQPPTSGEVTRNLESFNKSAVVFDKLAAEQSVDSLMPGPNRVILPLTYDGRNTFTRGNQEVFIGGVFYSVFTAQDTVVDNLEYYFRNVTIEGPNSGGKFILSQDVYYRQRVNTVNISKIQTFADRFTSSGSGYEITERGLNPFIDNPSSPNFRYDESDLLTISWQDSGGKTRRFDAFGQQNAIFLDKRKSLDRRVTAETEYITGFNSRVIYDKIGDTYEFSHDDNTSLPLSNPEDFVEYAEQVSEITKIGYGFYGDGIKVILYKVIGVGEIQELFQVDTPFLDTGGYYQTYDGHSLLINEYSSYYSTLCGHYVTFADCSMGSAAVMTWKIEPDGLIPVELKAGKLPPRPTAIDKDNEYILSASYWYEP